MAGCSAYDSRPPADSTPLPLTATAELRDAYGRSMGTAIITQMGDGIRVAVQGMNMPAGAHGIHIHQTGVCAPPDFASAGPHWNPRGSQHGKDNPAGMHAGDLPKGWRGREILPATQDLGSRWQQEGRSVALAVPSVLIPDEYCVLLNPEHPHTDEVLVSYPVAFEFDERL